MDERSTVVGSTTKLRAVPPREDSALDRRRHDAFDLKLQLKKHKALAIGVGVASAAAAVAVVLRSRRKNAVQHLPWSPWRVAPEVAQKSRRVALKREPLSTKPARPERASPGV